jgi:hypothetical protein
MAPSGQGYVDHIPELDETPHSFGDAAETLGNSSLNGQDRRCVGKGKLATRRLETIYQRLPRTRRRLLSNGAASKTGAYCSPLM